MNIFREILALTRPAFNLELHLSKSAEAPRHFTVPERDDGKYARRLFSVYAKAEADFQKARGSV